MAACSNVVVLCPNGRRQIVKVTPNTSLLQVLEDACKKQGFNPQDYDIMHYNKKLDLSHSVRFSNVPNNAQLELCPVSSKRQERPVTIGLQLESGERILHDFQPSCNLWDLVTDCTQSRNDIPHNEEQEPVCIYTRREIAGEESLRKTTLRSLGLTSGKAVIRLIHRPKGSIPEQAHVSTPITKPSFNDFVIDEWKPVVPGNSETSVPASLNKSESLNKENETKVSGGADDMMEVSSEDPQQSSKPENSNVSVPEPKPVHDWGVNVDQSKAISNWDDAAPSSQNKSTKEDNWKTGLDSGSSIHIWGSGKSLNEAVKSSEMEVDVQNNGVIAENTQEEANYEVHYLGERDALLFHLDDIPKMTYEDLPDDFYELTMDDALYMLADLKRQRRELEERPLETTLLRLTKQAAREKRYKRTIIRVQFPNRHVLQACFAPSETIAVVMDFVRGFLEDPTQDFYLFTTPPKTVLRSDETLFDAGLVPAALVYFGTRNESKQDILREGLRNKVTKAEAVFRAASLARKAIQKEDIFGPPPAEEESHENAQADASVVPQTSVRQVPASDAHKVESRGKVPKWLKLSK